MVQVLLDCGHGGLCRRCGQLMFARPPHQCPVCRRAVSAIVHLARRPHTGDAADVVGSAQPCQNTKWTVN